MRVIKLVLKWVRGIIYALYGLVVLFFPVTELLRHISKETRLFKFNLSLPIQDVILPALLLAIAYAGIAALLRRVQPKTLPREMQSLPTEEKHVSA